MSKARWIIVSSQPYIVGVVDVQHPHPEMPEWGFDTESDAKAWYAERMLSPTRWHILAWEPGE